MIVHGSSAWLEISSAHAVAHNASRTDMTSSRAHCSRGWPRPPGTCGHRQRSRLADRLREEQRAREPAKALIRYISGAYGSGMAKQPRSTAQRGVRRPPRLARTIGGTAVMAGEGSLVPRLKQAKLDLLPILHELLRTHSVTRTA